MRKYISKKWTIALILFTIICTVYLNENGSIESYAKGAFAGGNIVCFDQCLTPDNNVTLTFPLISSFDVNTLKFSSLDSIVNNYVNCSLTFDNSQMTIYNGYKIYLFTLSITEKEGCQSGYNNIIKGINLIINGSNYYYETPNFKLFNGTYLSNCGEYSVNNGDISLINSPSQIFSLPDESSPLTNTFISSSDCTIISMTPSAFVNFNNISYKNTIIDAQNIHSELTANSPFEITYSLNYTEQKCDTCITKSSLIIKYYKDGTSGIFVTNTPLLIFPGDSTDYAIKTYIDNIF